MQDLALPSDAFRFGSVTVVPSLNRLVWADRTEDLEPRLMRVLAILAETPGEAVTRDALLDAVWGETVVNEDALTRAVSELRKALGEEARAIETIRGRGYRLTLPVRALALPPPPAPPPARSETAPVLPDTPRRPLVLLALGLAAAALVVALWAAQPRATVGHAMLGERAEPSSLDLPSLDLPRADESPFRLDSTSPYYIPGASELGVYYDSTEDRYFRFVPDGASESGGLSSGP